MGYLEDKVAIVTGGSRGIGRAAALRMAQQGAKVVLCARDEARLGDVARKINTSGGAALAVPCRLESESDIAGVVRAAAEAYGRVDILANIGQGNTKGAGEALEKLEPADATYLFNTGPLASLLFMQHCLPYMKERGGAIINVSSRYADIGGAGFAAFGMAKSAIEALTHMAAVEWGRYGIRTNCIRPIAMQDDRPKIQKSILNTMLKGKIPMGYLASPYEDIAPLVAFLASDEARYLNGEVIAVDGGLSRCSSTG